MSDHTSISYIKKYSENMYKITQPGSYFQNYCSNVLDFIEKQTKLNDLLGL